MSLKRKFLICSLAFAPLTSFNTFAATGDNLNAGTVHFTGELVEPSCAIVGDSGTDNNVSLGTYLTSEFATTGAESDLVPFNVTLKDCPASSDGLPSVQITFNGDTSLTKSSTLLNVSKITTQSSISTDAPAATGVGIAISLMDTPEALLKLDGSEDQVIIPLSTKSKDYVKADFYARYKSFADTVTAGPADGDLAVNILYR